jgi:hypothetical protein
VLGGIADRRPRRRACFGSHGMSTGVAELGRG